MRHRDICDPDQTGRTECACCRTWSRSEACKIAAGRAKAAGVEIEWLSGFARDAANLEQFDKVVFSLTFHQGPVDEKRAGLDAMVNATKPGGVVLVTDYATQRSWMMREAVKIVQSADGKTNTPPNADEFLEQELGRIPGRTTKVRMGLGHVYGHNFPNGF